MITRRSLLTAIPALGASTVGLSTYAVAWEPRHVRVTRYALTPTGWPRGLRVRMVALADLHACEPWMGAEQIEAIVARANALEPDVTVLLGDYVAGSRIARVSTPLTRPDIGRLLGGLKAPLGVHGVLGNHDWWEEPNLQRDRRGPTEIGRQLERFGVRVLENDVVRLQKDGREFWVAGLGDQWAFWGPKRGRERWSMNRFGYTGADDLPGTLAKVTGTAPVVLLAHEPDIFPSVPDRVALTLSGHTHGGQVQVLGYCPFVPSMFGTRYMYGHVVEDSRHLIVSSGLGCSGVPVRFGAPPEIVEIELGGGHALV